MSNSLVQGQAHGHWTTASGIAFSIVNSMLLFANCALLTLAVAAHSAPRRLFDSTDQKGLQSVQVTLLRLPRRLVLFRLAIGGPCKQWQRAPNSVPSEACFDLSPTAQRQFGWPGFFPQELRWAHTRVLRFAGGAVLLKPSSPGGREVVPEGFVVRWLGIHSIVEWMSLCVA